MAGGGCATVYGRRRPGAVLRRGWCVGCAWLLERHRMNLWSAARDSNSRLTLSTGNSTSPMAPALPQVADSPNTQSFRRIFLTQRHCPSAHPRCAASPQLRTCILSNRSRDRGGPDCLGGWCGAVGTAGIDARGSPCSTNRDVPQSR